MTHKKNLKKESEIKTIPKTFFLRGVFNSPPEKIHEDPVIYEQIQGSNYIAYHPENGSWTIERYIQLTPDEIIKDKMLYPFRNNEVRFYPRIDESIEKGQIILPPEPIKTDKLVPIIYEIEEKAKKWFYISEEEYDVFRMQINLAISSWFLDSIYSNPMETMERVAGLIGDVGVSGGGKKRWLSLIRSIAYRPIYVLSSTKVPSTYRLIEPWGTATLCIDEADQKETGSEAEWIQFLNGRYDGTPIPRYNTSTGKVDIFSSFGLTAMALRRMPMDEGIASRMVKIDATISPEILPEIANEDMFNDFQEIRAKLFYLRLKYYGKLKLVNKTGLPAEHSWRGKEVLALIMTLSQIDPDIINNIKELSETLTKKEVEKLSNTWDGIIINEIYNFITNDKTKIDQRNDGYYFYKEIEKDGKTYTNALTLQYIAKSLSSTASNILRSLKQFHLNIYDVRFRIEQSSGFSTNPRGVLKFPIKQIDNINALFKKYIVDYDDYLKEYIKNFTTKQAKIDGLTDGDGEKQDKEKNEEKSTPDKTETQKTDTENSDKKIDSEPHEPLEPVNMYKDNNSNLKNNQDTSIIDINNKETHNMSGSCGSSGSKGQNEGEKNLPEPHEPEKSKDISNKAKNILNLIKQKYKMMEDPQKYEVDRTKSNIDRVLLFEFDVKNEKERDQIIQYWIDNKMVLLNDKNELIYIDDQKNVKISVRILKDIDQVQDIDRVLDLRKEDIVSVSENLAKLLIEKGIAEKLNGGQGNEK